MSKQLTISAAASILMMAVYVLFGGQAVHQPLGLDAAPAAVSPIEISVALPRPESLLPSLR